MPSASSRSCAGAGSHVRSFFHRTRGIRGAAFAGRGRAVRPCGRTDLVELVGGHAVRRDHHPGAARRDVPSLRCFGPAPVAHPGSKRPWPRTDRHRAAAGDGAGCGSAFHDARFCRHALRTRIACRHAHDRNDADLGGGAVRRSVRRKVQPPATWRHGGRPRRRALHRRLCPPCQSCGRRVARRSAVPAGWPVLCKLHHCAAPLRHQSLARHRAGERVLRRAVRTDLLLLVHPEHLHCATGGRRVPGCRARHSGRDPRDVLLHRGRAPAGRSQGGHLRCPRAGARCIDRCAVSQGNPGCAHPGRNCLGDGRGRTGGDGARAKPR